MKREDFLARVRDAAAAGRRYRVEVATVPPGAGYVGAAGDLCEAFAREVAQVGGEPLLVPDWSAATHAVEQLLDVYRPRSVLSWQHAALERLSLPHLLEARGVHSLRYPQLAALPEGERRSAILAADLGISSVDFAVAETGTLAVRSRIGQERVTSLVPPVHIAVVASDQLLPDLFDLFQALAAAGVAELPANMALISGPSKTGDIELELTTGVHGPGKWHVVVVREPLRNT